MCELLDSPPTTGKAGGVGQLDKQTKNFRKKEKYNAYPGFLGNGIRGVELLRKGGKIILHTHTHCKHMREFCKHPGIIQIHDTVKENPSIKRGESWSSEEF